MTFRTSVLLFCCVLSCSASLRAAPALRQDHPIIGTWQFTLPDGSCHEIYRMHEDGSSIVTSAQEVAEAAFVIEDQPDSDGFYKQVDTIIKDNGKRDCGGAVSTVGQRSTNYILFHHSGNMFLSCAERDLRRCIGPFVRLRGVET